MPIVTVLGLTVALMIGGAVVTETVFGLPGVVAAPIAYAWIKRELDNAGLL